MGFAIGALKGYNGEAKLVQIEVALPSVDDPGFIVTMGEQVGPEFGNVHIFL